MSALSLSRAKRKVSEVCMHSSTDYKKEKEKRNAYIHTHYI
jgi:hypothetical protein